jgi:hypothetical protein
MEIGIFLIMQSSWKGVKCYFNLVSELDFLLNIFPGGKNMIDIAIMRITIEAMLFNESRNFLRANIICAGPGFNNIAATNTRNPNKKALG